MSQQQQTQQAQPPPPALPPAPSMSTAMSSTSVFSFATPYPPSITTAAAAAAQAATAAMSANANNIPTGTSAMSSQAATAATLKQRRVSLALPNSPRVFSAWNFRDDTTIDAHVASSGAPFPSPPQPTSQDKDKPSDKEKDKDKKGKMRKTNATYIIDHGDEFKPTDNLSGTGPVTEKRQRKKWSEEETQMLVNGCNIWGVGNWKAILNDPNLKFDNRSPVDLKDRFRTFFPDAYKLHYPNAKTHLSSKVRSTLPDGSCLFEKTRSKKRRPFTPEEDQALKAGYEKYGTVWSTIVKDPIFQQQKRRSTDLRDRFRNAFPQLYQAAGYKPRSMPRKKRGDANVSAPRATADDQLLPSRMATKTRRRRSRTTSGHSFSVPQSAAVSEDEDSSDEEEDDSEIKRSSRSLMEIKEMTPQPETTTFTPPEAMLNEVTMLTIDQTDDLAFPDFLPDSSQALSDAATDQSIWSSGPRSPQQVDSWSSAATTTTASPTSSHLSINDYFMDTATIGRREGANMIGKSAWGTSDWLSANPRMEPSGTSNSSNSSYVEGPSPPPSSPFSFSHLSHGIMDRYDLFQNSSFAHDFASEVGASDAYSTFSDPELIPMLSMRGFTHHSNYAGDLIFGARTHQPAAPMNSFGGLGLSGMQHEQTAGINPMQLHTPSLPGIDELAAINLNDDEPMITAPTTGDSPSCNVKEEANNTTLGFDVDLSSLIHLPPQTMEEIAGLSSNVQEMEQESNVTPPATPALSGRTSRELQSQSSTYSAHNRSMSVPPFERVVSRPHPPPGHATPHPAPTRSLSLFDIPPLSHEAAGSSSSVNNNNAIQSQSPSNPMGANASSFFGASLINDSFKSLDLSDLIFLDLHAPSSSSDFANHDIIDAHTDELRNGLALDLAQSPSHTSSPSSAMLNGHGSSNASTGGSMDSGTPLSMFNCDTIGRAAGSALHSRVQSQTTLGVAPKDLFLASTFEVRRDLLLLTLQTLIFTVHDAIMPLKRPRRRSEHERFTRRTRQAGASWTTFEKSGKRKDLDSAITHQQEALDCCPLDHPERDRALHDLAHYLYLRYIRWGDVDNLEKAITLGRDALALRPIGHELRSKSLLNLANSTRARFEYYGCMEGLDEAITLEREALDLRPEGHPDRAVVLGNLACSLQARFENGGGMEDLEEVISLEREALALQGESHPFRSSALSNLAASLSSRYEHVGRVEDLEEAITLEREALTLRPDGRPDRPISMGNLAISLRSHFERTGNWENLKLAITMEREALALRPEGHPDRSLSLSNLATCLCTNYEHEGNVDELEEAIQLERAALELRAEGHPEHSYSLGNLANSLWKRFKQKGSTEDLEESIKLSQASLVLLSEGHPLRSCVLTYLANSLITRFVHIGGAGDLEEAITLSRSALELEPEGHPRRSFSLQGLANSLLTRFENYGRLEDLEESIVLQRATLELRPEGNPHRSVSLSNLANSLSLRFGHSGRIEDLGEAIDLDRIAIELQPHGHPGHSSLLSNLAASLCTHFESTGRIENLEEAISLNQEALALRPKGHPDHSLSLLNLAASLSVRFEDGGRVEDLDEAIVLQRTALDLHPGGHPLRSTSLSNLANYLSSRYERDGEKEVLEEVIQLEREVLALQQEGHPNHALSLKNLAESLYIRFKKEGDTNDFEESIQSLRDATAHVFSGFSLRLEAVMRWIAIARSHDHHTLLEARKSALSLLQRALTLRPTLSAQHKFLAGDSDYQTFALDAAAHAIEKGEFSLAIEFLEQGRALLWSQMRGLRTPLDRLSETSGTLAKRFEDCNRRLGALIASSESQSTRSGTGGNIPRAFKERASEDEKLVQMRQLSEEQEAIICDIRRLSGFENFLRAAPFEVVQQAASEGPIIVLNHSEQRCDALIVLARGNEPCTCVPLDEAFYGDAIRLHEELLRTRKKPGVSSSKYDEILRRVMKVLFDRVVSQVVQRLKEFGITEGSRIWWCPTSVLSAFPFHAAGPYEGANGVEKYLFNDYISSYIPSLTSLINARSGVRVGGVGGERMLFVADMKLPSAKKERDAIIRILRFKQLLDDRATPEAVLAALRKANWVHFVCHGILDKEPFNSSLKLRGGKLTLLDIAQANLPNAEFAFLSACHTAEHAPNSALDEALHLAAAVQFCGFRSVVGTMWKLLDTDGPYLSSGVYSCLMRDLDEGEIRFKRAAGAVREAALRLKVRGDEEPNGTRIESMAERWVNLVHIGA